MPLYPLFLKLDDTPCLVVGAGDIGAQKAEGLLQAAAHVVIVALEIGNRMREAIAAHPEQTTVHEREFEPGDCEGMRVVISATGNAAVDDLVYHAAKRARALVNVVDVKERCDFYAGSVVQKGPLAILIGTEGLAPSVARYTRLLLERTLPQELGVLADAMGNRRAQLLQHLPDFVARAKVLAAFVDRTAPRLRPGLDVKEIEAWLEREVLAPASAPEATDDDGHSFLALEIDLDATGSHALGSVVVGGRYFASATVPEGALGDGDVAFLQQCVRDVLTALDRSTTTGEVIVRAHAVEFASAASSATFEPADRVLFAATPDESSSSRSPGADAAPDVKTILDRALAVVVPVLEIA